MRNRGDLVGALCLVSVCTVGACTKVRAQVDPLPATPLPSVVRAPPTRYAWPAPPSPPSLPPDAAPAAPSDTLNGDPKGLKREDLNNALQGLLPVLAACFRGPDAPTSIGLSFDAEPEGRVANLQVSGATAEGARCVMTTLAAVRWPAFEGKAVPVQYPISLYRPPAPRVPASASESAQPSVPVTGAAVVAPPPPPGTSTAPYVPATLPATPGSAPGADAVKVFIQP